MEAAFQDSLALTWKVYWLVGHSRAPVITCLADTASPRPTTPTRSKCQARCNPEWSWHGRAHRQPCWSPPNSDLAIPIGVICSALGSPRTLLSCRSWCAGLDTRNVL